MLPANLTLDSVHLTVTSLDRSIAFYERSLGFQLHRREAGVAGLGAGQSDLLSLAEKPAARRPARTTGLYHFAIVVPSRLELAQVLKRMAETQTQADGFSDHYVSEAIYLSDPDGNGIEMYRDRPRSQWYDTRGKFNMGTDPLDLDGLLSELPGGGEPWSGLHPDTVLGHVHLHVRDIPEAQTFYCSVIGFDLMASLGSALFVSAGGYHHHVGLNVWNGVGAPPPPPESVGLRHFVIRVPGADEVDRLLDRLSHADVPVAEDNHGWFFRDPSQNGIVVQAGPD